MNQSISTTQAALLDALNAAVSPSVRAHSSFTAIGFDRTLERGEVVVYSSLDMGKVVYLVAPLGSPTSADGIPSGLRDAPIGTHFAARVHMGAEVRPSDVEQYCSKDFVGFDRS